MTPDMVLGDPGLRFSQSRTSRYPDNEIEFSPADAGIDLAR